MPYCLRPQSGQLASATSLVKRGTTTASCSFTPALEKQVFCRGVVFSSGVEGRDKAGGCIVWMTLWQLRSCCWGADATYDRGDMNGVIQVRSSKQSYWFNPVQFQSHSDRQVLEKHKVYDHYRVACGS
jgi:hypothetical protein